MRVLLGKWPFVHRPGSVAHLLLSAHSLVRMLVGWLVPSRATSSTFTLIIRTPVGKHDVLVATHLLSVVHAIAFMEVLYLHLVSFFVDLVDISLAAEMVFKLYDLFFQPLVLSLPVKAFIVNAQTQSLVFLVEV